MDRLEKELLRPEIDELVGQVARARFRHVAGIEANPELSELFAAHDTAAHRRTVETLQAEGEKGLAAIVAQLRVERAQAGEEEAWRAASCVARGVGPDGPVLAPGAQLATTRERNRERRLAFGRAASAAERLPARDAAIEKRARARAEVGLLPDWEGVVEADALLSESDDGYRDVLRWLARRELDLAPPPDGDLERADLLHLLSLHRWSGLFRPGLLARELERTLGSLGLNPSAIRIDDEPRPAKWPGAHSFETRVSLRRQGGAPDWLATFEAAGQAITAAHVAPHRRHPASLTTLGALVGSLLLDPRFLSTVLDVERKDLADLIRALALRQLFRLRASAAGFRIATEVERGTTGAAWYEAHREALTLAAGATWPIGLWGRDGDAGAAGARLRGAAEAELLRRSLVERFDEDWWRNPRGGAELRSVLAGGVVPPGGSPKLALAAESLLEKLQ